MSYDQNPSKQTEISWKPQKKGVGGGIENDEITNALKNRYMSTFCSKCPTPTKSFGSVSIQVQLIPHVNPQVLRTIPFNNQFLWLTHEA